MVASGGELMRAVALFDVLQDFGSRPAAAATSIAAGERSVAPHPAPPDTAAIVSAAVEKAEAAIEARLRLEYEATLELERQGHAAEIEAMLRGFGEQAGQVIAARIDEMEGRIGSLAAAASARILGTFLSDELQQRSIASLARSITEAATDRETVRIEVRGPQFMFETLQAALGERAGSLHYVESPGFDLLVSIDGNLFETRLAEWSAALAEILA
jgi:hypothetical protein